MELFDYSKYLKTKKIAGIVSIKNEDIVKLQENQINWIQTKIYQFKNNLIEKIKSILSKDTQGVCIGLLIFLSHPLKIAKRNHMKNSIERFLKIL